MAERLRLSRRRLLALAGTLPLGAIIAACGGSAPLPQTGGGDSREPEIATVTPTPEPPLVVAAGEERRTLMGGTPQETPLYIFGSGRPGPVLAVLGGVHGNEPGGWLAAEHIRDELRPGSGALLVIPRANLIATQQFVRTTDELGDLNRLYPGDPNGLPMARLAYEIVQTLREFRASLVLDLHESWAFFKDRTDTQTGTAFLGQTVSSSTVQGVALAREILEQVNQRIRAPHEEMVLREWPPRGFAMSQALPGATAVAEPGTQGSGAVFGGSRSSLGLSNHIPGLIAILVEMGQQQAIERRVALHVDIVQEAARRIGI